MSKQRKKRKEKRHPHWVHSNEPALELPIHATLVTVPEEARASYERLWEQPLLANVKLRSEEAGLNPLAVLNVVLDLAGTARAAGASPLGAKIIGTPGDVARVHALGRELWLASPGANVSGVTDVTSPTQEIP